MKRWRENKGKNKYRKEKKKAKNEILKRVYIPSGQQLSRDRNVVQCNWTSVPNALSRIINNAQGTVPHERALLRRLADRLLALAKGANT